VTDAPGSLPSREVFEALYDAYHRQAFGLAYRLLGQSADAEDVVQEAFLAAWRSLPTHDPSQGSTRSWLLSIVRNRAIDVLRTRHRRPESALDPELDPADPSDVPLQAASHMNGERTTQVLASLPPEQRRVLELAYFGGLTHVEIADRLGLPLGTVKGRLRLGLSRARAVLRPELEHSQYA